MNNFSIIEAAILREIILDQIPYHPGNSWGSNNIYGKLFSKRFRKAEIQYSIERLGKNGVITTAIDNTGEIKVSFSEDQYFSISHQFRWAIGLRRAYNTIKSLWNFIWKHFIVTIITAILTTLITIFLTRFLAN